jgi:hypothetical protein
LDVATPPDLVTPEQIYSDRNTVLGAVNGIYTQTFVTNFYYYFLPFYLSPLTDDSYHTSTSYDDLKNNNNSPTNAYTAYFWEYPYQTVFIANELIAQLPKTNVITDEERKGFIGEVKFFRAYGYFILTSLFGDVPYITTTNILETSLQPREKKEVVVAALVQDLKDAETALAGSTNTNAKVTKAAASALLARQYLYNGEWALAEQKANEVISTEGIELESDLAKVFVRSSKETILRASSSGSSPSYIDRTYIASLFINTNYFRLTDDFVKSFEEGDKRATQWLTTVSTFKHPYKYRRTSATASGEAEDLVILRLAEQYLIRAEAAAQQNKTTEAVADLNLLRQRAGLEDLSETLTKAEVLLAIEHERRSELFSEDIHRWWDLVRTKRADAVLGNKTAFPDKKWASYKALLPVPEKEFGKNKNLTQNLGYGDIN